LCALGVLPMLCGGLETGAPSGVAVGVGDGEGDGATVVDAGAPLGGLDGADRALGSAPVCGSPVPELGPGRVPVVGSAEFSGLAGVDDGSWPTAAP